MAYETLSIRRDGPIEHVTLNRPDVRNAFNPALIAELTDWADGMAERQEVRVAVLSGAGKAFCAGADLAWMAESAAFTHEENVRDAHRLAALFDALDTMPVPLIGRVHGAALGGGAGLVAVCDIVVAEAETSFGFTEVKLGLVPAAISPYVVAKIGRSAARELFLTGARFHAARAREIGLVHAVAGAGDLDGVVARYVRELLSAGPEATRAAKALTRQVAAARPDEVSDLTANAIASRRVSDEGQEGLRAFLEKRPPRWVEPS